MIYILYNDGWSFEMITPEDTEIIPKISPADFDQKIADRAVEEMGYSDYWLINRKETGVPGVTFEYGGYDEDGDEMVITLQYEFSPVRGWYQFTSAALSASFYSGY